MNSCKVSVIMPVYNAAKYIEEAIQSVLNSSLKDVELLIIDDGSVDESAEIAKKYADNDMRVRIILIEHVGVSHARNVGLDEATGEYAFFMDADDLIHEKLIEELYEIAVDEAATLVTEPLKRFSNGADIIDVAEENTNKVLDGSDDIIKYYINNFGTYGRIGGVLVSLKKFYLRFDETYRRGEDSLYMFRCALESKKWIIFNKAWYYYRRHEGNVTSINDLDAVENMRNCYLEMARFAEQGGYCFVADYWRKSALDAVCGNLFRARTQKNKHEKRQYSDYFFDKLNDPVHKLSRYKKVKLVSNYYFHDLYVALRKIKNKICCKKVA